MAASTLRAARGGLNLFHNAIRTQSNHYTPLNIITKVPVRYGGHGRVMIKQPSRFDWYTYKDDWHFYVLLGVIPLGTIITLSNLFIGKAELADIPEGYEPEEHEYYRHPIQRFFAKYVYKSAQQHYEMMLHTINIEQQKKRLRKWEAEVELKMAEHKDVKGWYYMPVDAGRVYRGREYIEDYDKTKGL